MTPAQCHAARALIGMTQATLARSAVVMKTLIAGYETGVRTLRPADLKAIREAWRRRASSSSMGIGRGRG